MPSLLSLPWELREQIWILALQVDFPLRRPRIEVFYQFNQPAKRKLESPFRVSAASLLCTCRQIEEEAAPVFYELNDFIPYTSLYVDSADYKDDHGFCRDVPRWDEWVTKSDGEKHEQLGLAARYIGHVVSLVVYDDMVKNMSYDPARRDRTQATRRGSTLLAEMLFWLRAKAPQIQSLSIRYRDSRARILESFTKGWVVSLSTSEQRLYQAVRRFPQLRLLDIRRVYARPGQAPNWGYSAELYELEARDPRLKGLRGQLLGSRLHRATTVRWSEANTFGVRCGVRWALILNTRETIPSVHHLRNRYIEEKIPALSTPLEPTWSWSLHTVETWGKSQEIINSEILLSTVPWMLDLRSRTSSQMIESERSIGGIPIQLSQSLWHRIWSMPPEIRTRIWSLTLRRPLPLHRCAQRRGEPCIGAMLKVDRRTNRECHRLFIKVNTFSILPSLQYNPFTSAIVQDEIYHTAMGLVSRENFEPRQLPPMGHFDALRSLHVDMWDIGYGSPSRRDYTRYNEVFILLHAAAPLLSELSITYYSEDSHSRADCTLSLWHRGIFHIARKYRHLRLLTILFALEDTLYVNVPWMQRLREAKWSLMEDEHPDKFAWADMAMEIADLFHGRVAQVRTYHWDSTWAKSCFEGYAWRMELSPRCKELSEGHECLPFRLDVDPMETGASAVPSIEMLL